MPRKKFFATKIERKNGGKFQMKLDVVVIVGVVSFVVVVGGGGGSKFQFLKWKRVVDG